MDPAGWERRTRARRELDCDQRWVNEVIKVLGQQAPPEELESIILLHPNAVDARLLVD